MIRKTFFLGAALAAALSAPASAGRNIQIDQFSSEARICALSDNSCTASNSNLFFSTGALSRIFIYREGVISFGAPIGLSRAVFDVARSSEVFDVYTGRTTLRGPNGVSYSVGLINFFIPGTIVRPGITGPRFQYQYSLSGSGALELSYAYRDAPLGPPAGATIGYDVAGRSDSVTNANGLRLGGDRNDSSFDFDLTNGSEVGLQRVTFNPVGIVAPIGGIPEPATWAMLIMGFGVIGAAMRNRRSRVLAIA